MRGQRARRRGVDGERMRIIAGEWRSRRIARPPAANTRPMPDRVRESIFNILGAFYETPGRLPALHVGDVFAGGGSMGLEALSRGATRCCFFERDAAALTALSENLRLFGVGESGTIVTRDAWQCGTTDPTGEPFDLVFLDPPYADTEDPSEAGFVWRYLKRLAAASDRVPLTVFHHRVKVDYSVAPPPPWRVVDRRTFGTTGIVFFST